MKFNLKYTYIFMLFLAIGCEEEGRVDLIDTSGSAPDLITNIEITPTSGGANVIYDIPNDDNYLYAKAVYEAPTGVVREAKSSKYENVLILEGFGDTESHNVKFYSVGLNTKESEPVEKSFSPLTAPIFNVANDLEINSIFGGIEINYDNPDEANIILQAFIDIDTTGTAIEYVPLDKLYTQVSRGRWVIRGLESKETNFGVLVSDPFGNATDLIEVTRTPYFEIEIPKVDFADLRLPNDAVPLRAKNPITQLWDDNSTDYANFYSTDQSVYPLPKWISIDFGAKYVLSRLKMWQRYKDEYTGGRIPADWEIYGSNEPNPDGSWDSWTLLQGFGEPGKPSGLPFGQRTQEDIEFARKGFDYEFETISDGYRFYRLKWNKVQDFKDMVLIGEMTFWGQLTE